MGAAASVEFPDSSVIFKETKEEYDRRIAAGDSKEQIFCSLRDIVANRLAGEQYSIKTLENSDSTESTTPETAQVHITHDSTTSEVKNTDEGNSMNDVKDSEEKSTQQEVQLQVAPHAHSNSLLDAATLAAVKTVSDNKESTIESNINEDLSSKALPEEDKFHAAPRNPFHDDHEAEGHIDDGISSGTHASNEKGFGRAVGSSRAALDLVQNLTPVFTTDVLTDLATLKMILRYAEANKVHNGVDMLRFYKIPSTKKMATELQDELLQVWLRTERDPMDIYDLLRVDKVGPNDPRRLLYVEYVKAYVLG